MNLHIIEKNRALNLFIKLLFIISTPFMIRIFSLSVNILYMIFEMLISFLIVMILVFKYDFIEKAFKNISCKQMIVAIIFSIYILHLNFIIILKHIKDVMFIVGKFDKFLPNFFLNILNDKIIYILLPFYLLAIFPCFVFISFILNNFSKSIKQFFNVIDRKELKYITTLTMFFSILIVIVFIFTNVLNTKICDIIYTLDTNFMEEVFIRFGMNENDIRHPLFGLFALPISLPAKVISNIFPFIPNLYLILLLSFQLIILNIAIIFLCRMLGIEGSLKFLIASIFAITYPSILFIFFLEKYVLTFSYLIFFLYVYIKKNNDDRYKKLFYIGITGTLITSGILFPLISSNNIKSNFKGFILDILNTALIFFVIIILIGQLKVFVDGFNRVNLLLSNFGGGKISFLDKIYQYTNFISSCFIKPTTTIYSGDNLNPFFQIFVPNYQMVKATSINIFGVLLLIISAIGFVINRKEIIVKISGFWILLSFIILIIIGYGIQENGLVLYSLYFSWAFFVLIYKAIDKIFSKLIEYSIHFQKIKIIFLVSIFIVLLVINTIGLIDLIKFGIEYYPTDFTRNLGLFK